MAVLQVQKPALAGLNPTFSSADAAGDEFDNDGRTILHIRNDGAGSITVTIDSQQPCSHGYDHDEQVTIPAGEERIVGTFPPARWNDSAGRVHVSYSDVTSVTVAAIRIAGVV